MSRPAQSYAISKAKVRAFLLDYLADVARDCDGSVPLPAVRKLLHYKGTGAFLDPVLRDLEKDGIISVWREDRKGIIYLLGGKDVRTESHGKRGSKSERA